MLFTSRGARLALYLPRPGCLQATTPSSSDWLISSVTAHAQADTALVKLDLRVVPDPSDTMFVTITPLGCPGIQLDDWVRLDLKVTSDPCDHVSVTISPATPGNQIDDLVTLDITIPSDTVFITLTPLPRGKQVAELPRDMCYWMYSMELDTQAEMLLAAPVALLR